MPISGPTVVRRQLGRRLRRLREAAGKSDRDVEEAGIAGPTKLWRIESGKVPVKMPDIRAMCWLYGADPETTDVLAAMASGTQGQGWWEDYSLPSWFGLYVGLETYASEILSYDPELVHGLLQTPDYTRAVMAAVGVATPEGIEHQVKTRAQRQRAVADRDPPLKLTAILGAGVLHRQVGTPEVMRAQVDHLRASTRPGSVDIRVLPWDAGAHAGMHIGAFTILNFADVNDPSVVYLESHTGARYLERAEELSEYRRVYEAMYAKSIPVEEYEHVSSGNPVDQGRQVGRQRRPVRRTAPHP